MRAHGFTLIELIVTVAIVGLLATAAFPLAEMAARRSKELELRLAIERNELELYFQPQFQGTKGHMIGAEALLRWHHPTRGMVGPAG